MVKDGFGSFPLTSDCLLYRLMIESTGGGLEVWLICSTYSTTGEINNIFPAVQGSAFIGLKVFRLRGLAFARLYFIGF